ncbi:SMI1/KNR4 family protein [Maricaulis sp. D1M11]|uniref:SMI1/KNR4 family protein n=1 Tax=Maricaulis sp. D1M11 TaxID=3076117 RepID=UPI0039B493B3
MFDQYTIFGTPNPVSEADLATAEAQLNLRFPTGYRAFVTKFGKGILGDDHLNLTYEEMMQNPEKYDDDENTGSEIRVYTPADILDTADGVEAWRERITKYWFWNDGADVLSKDKAVECVVFADTTVGDEIIFHPSQPDRIYVLPRDEATIYAVEGGLPGVIEWMFSSGTLYSSFTARCFKPD